MIEFKRQVMCSIASALVILFYFSLGMFNGGICLFAVSLVGRALCFGDLVEYGGLLGRDIPKGWTFPNTSWR